MLTGRHIGRRILATVAAAAMCSLGVAGARAQQPGAIGGIDFSPPAPAAALEIYKNVEAWVRQVRTPMDPAGLAPLPAAAVTLRYEGSIVGRGVAIALDPAGAPGISLLATSRALSEARNRLEIPQDALFEENLKAAAARITITVELAGRPIPLDLKEFGDAINEVGPGLDGVAVRMGDKTEAMLPETMLVTGTDAAGALRALVSKVSGDPTLGLKGAGELREKDGFAFYKLGVVCVGQTRPGGAPVFLQRGGRLVSQAEMDEAGLRRWADQLAAHLVAETGTDPRIHEFPRGLHTMAPTGRLEQMVLSLALHRYSRLPSAAAGGIATEAARLTMEEMAQIPDVRSCADLAGTATAVVLYSDGLGVPDRRHPANLASLYLDASDAIRKYVQDQVALPDAVPAEARSLVALAIAQLKGVTPPPAYRANFVRQVFILAPPASLASEMPWLGWAAIAASPAAGAGHGGDIEAAPALRELRAQAWQHQLQPESLRADAQDLAGGIMFTTTRQPLPTWQAARPLAFIATMLGDPRLTEEHEVSRELARLLASLRFLRQLTADEAECHMYKDPAKAIGGVRNSLFDQRMPPEATAMTLLAVCETLKSLEAIKARQAGGQEPAPAARDPIPKAPGK